MAEKVNAYLEQEEIQNFFPRQTIDRMSAYSRIPAGIRYYRKLLEEYPEEVKLLKEDKYGIEVELPSSWYRRPRRPGNRRLSDEQKAAAAERLQGARQKRKGGD